MQEILLLKGLPASGKTTFARSLVEKNKNWKRVNKDELRAMVDSGKWSRDNEQFILNLRDSIIESSIRKGYNVVVDDTNLSPKHYRTMCQMVDEFKNEGIEITIEEKVFDVDVDECIKRDNKRANSVGAEVIYRMYNQYLFKPKDYPFFHQSLPLAIISDVDGTLAKNVGRGHFDWSKVKGDKLCQEVALVVTAMHAQGYQLIITTGRDGSCEKETREWLAENHVDFDELFIRPAGNFERDEIIKERMFNDHIAGKYNVVGVFDDRPQVVRMWKRLGLYVFDCNQDYYKIEF